MNKRPVPRGYCVDCGVDFALHRARRSVADPLLRDKEIDSYVCPECGSYGVEEEPASAAQDVCTVVFRLKNGQADTGRFIYALACQAERWKDIEILSLQTGDKQYVMSSTVESEGVDHDE